MTPQMVLWALYGLATAAPGLMKDLARDLREGRVRRAVMDTKLLRRIADTTEGVYMDAYDFAVEDNYTARQVNESLARLERRGLIERHPDDGWVATDRGRVAAGNAARAQNRR